MTIALWKGNAPVFRFSCRYAAHDGANVKPDPVICAVIKRAWLAARWEDLTFVPTAFLG